LIRDTGLAAALSVAPPIISFLSCTVTVFPALTSSSGKPARVCYDNQNHIDKSIAANRVRLLFAQSKANAVPDFTYNMTKAIKKLVVLCGGVAEKKIF